MAYRDMPSGPVTGLGEAGPGYYQGQRRGNVTGRLAPREVTKADPTDLAMARHGLLDQGKADPNQGQLFNPDAVMGPRASDKDIVESSLVNSPTGMSSRKPAWIAGDQPYTGSKGFLPRLGNVAGETDPKKRSQVAQRKVEALTRTRDSLIESGSYDPDRSMFKQMNDSRQAAYDKAPGPANWYSGVDPNTGRNSAQIPGLANEAIDAAAARTGVSSDWMTRATAISSANAAWDANVPGTPDHRMVNVQGAEAGIRVGKAVRESNVLTASQFSMEDVDDMVAYEVGENRKSTGISPDKEVAGSPTTENIQKAVRSYVGAPGQEGNTKLPQPTQNIETGNMVSAKVANFDGALRFGASDPRMGGKAAQRIVSETWTDDRHDYAQTGVSDKGRGQVGVADVQAMTGRRFARSKGELNPDIQARTWVGQRGENTHVGETSGFLKLNRRTGKEEILDSALPGGGGQAPKITSRNLQRRGALPVDTTEWD